MTREHASIEVRYGWVVLFASLAVHTIGLGAPTILFLTLKPIAAEFDWPRAVPSMAYSLLMLGAGVGGLAMGWWMDRRGVMQPVVFGSVMIALGALLMSRADGQVTLYVANGLLIGLLGKAAMIAPLVANATRWFDRRRGLAVAIVSSGQGVAGALWPPIVSRLDAAVGWRETYQWFGLFALVTMVPLALLLRPRPPTARVRPRDVSAVENVRPLGASPGALQALLWVAVVGCCTAMAIPIVHLASHATDLGFAPVRAAEMLSVLFLAAFVSRIGFGVLADRIGGVRTMMLASACQAVVLLLFAFVDSLVGLYLAALLFGLGFAGIMPCYALLIRRYFPVEQAGWRIAAQYLFGALGMALGGWLGGAVFDRTGAYADAFLAGVAFNLVNLAIIASIHLRERRLALAPAAA